jgi:hypothetical protein
MLGALVQPRPKRFSQLKRFQHPFGQIKAPLWIMGKGGGHLFQGGLMMIIHCGMQREKHAIARVNGAQR